jgi:hypothetical protein
MDLIPISIMVLNKRMAELKVVLIRQTSSLKLVPFLRILKITATERSVSIQLKFMEMEMLKVIQTTKTRVRFCDLKIKILNKTL